MSDGTIPPIPDTEIIQLAEAYLGARPRTVDQSDDAKLRDGAYYGWGYFALRARGTSHEDALSVMRDTTARNDYYSPNPAEGTDVPALTDDEIIEVSARFVRRYQQAGVWQRQSIAENVRDELYYLRNYLTYRRASGHASAAARMERDILRDFNVPPEPGGGGEKRRGAVRLQGQVLLDDGGPFFSIGATLFWALWGWRHDRDRLLRNLDILAGAIDYVRVLGQVGEPGDSWHDRIVSHDEEGYWDRAAEFVDAAFERGIRTQVTIFGGAQNIRQGDRERIVDRWAQFAEGREEKLFIFEIANEYHNNGFDDEGSELRALSRRLKGRTSVLVASSAPHGEETDPMKAFSNAYRGDVADLASVHWSRSFGADGEYRPIRQPWDYQFLAGRGIPAPEAHINNEPIGPESSVNQDGDPSRIVLAAAVTGLCQGAAYTFHSGPGIRGGGQADRDVGRTANFDELPGIAEILNGFRWLKTVLPGDIASWHPENWHWPGNPFEFVEEGDDFEHTLVRAFATVREPRFFWMPFGVSERRKDSAHFRAKRACRCSFYSPLGEPLEERTLAAREDVHVTRDMIVAGEFL